MKTIVRSLALVGATAVAVAARSVAAVPASNPSAATLPFAEQFVMHSGGAKRDFLIQVSFPTQIRPDEKAAALYVLDGNGGFGLMADSVRILHPGAIATTYVVAIGYVNPIESDDLREVDLAHVKGTIRGLKLGGGGAAFEEFILKELRPFIEARYPVDPSKSVLLGHSLGGLFATTVLANRPDAFSGYLISSPSLQFDPEVLDRVKTAASHASGQRVYVSVGSEEGRVAIPAAEALHAALTAQGSKVETRYCKVPGYYHMSVTLTLASVALPFLLPPPPAPTPVVQRQCPSAIVRRNAK
jgi:predicted alpha/beta superfamily hydrolase